MYQRRTLLIAVVIAITLTHGTATALAVFRGEHTSPQFGYTVTWSSSWGPDGEPVSEEGEYDQLWLASDHGYAVYLGIFTPNDEEELVDAWVDAFSEETPDVDVFQPYKNGDPPQPLLLTYEDGDGPMVQSVAAVPLVPGASMLLIVHSQPKDMPAAERTNLLNGISLGVPSPDGVGFILGAGEMEQGRADLELAPADTYTVPVYCSVVEGGMNLVSKTVYGYCEWPSLLSHKALCIEDDSYFGGEGIYYLCRPNNVTGGAADPEELTLENAPERIFKHRVTCTDVVEQGGTIYGDCDTNMSLVNYECIDDPNGLHYPGGGKTYLCRILPP